MRSIPTFTLAIGLALPLFLPSPPAYAQTPATARQVAPFPDVPPDHWAYNAVNELHQLGIVVGYPDNTYAETYVPARRRGRMRWSGRMAPTPAPPPLRRRGGNDLTPTLSFVRRGEHEERSFPEHGPT